MGTQQGPYAQHLAVPSSSPLPRSMYLTQIFPEQEVKTKRAFFPWSSTEGFVSEAANLLLLRVMAWRQLVPNNARFLALDTEGKLCYSTYVRSLPGWGTQSGENRKGRIDRSGGRKSQLRGERGSGLGP